MFVIKLLMDYVSFRKGETTISAINGFLIGFDKEEVITVWKNQETEEITSTKHVSIEFALGFVAVIFTWQEYYEEDEETDDELGY